MNRICFCVTFCVRRTPNHSPNQGQRLGQRQTGKLVPRPNPCVRAYVRTLAPWYGRTDGHDVITKFSRLDGFTQFYSYGCSSRGRRRRPRELRYYTFLNSTVELFDNVATLLYTRSEMHFNSNRTFYIKFPL